MNIEKKEVYLSFIKSAISYSNEINFLKLCAPTYTQT